MPGVLSVVPGTGVEGVVIGGCAGIGSRIGWVGSGAVCAKAGSVTPASIKAMAPANSQEFICRFMSSSPLSYFLVATFARQ